CASVAPRQRSIRQGGYAISRDLRVNQMIRITPVRVVDENGTQLGVMPTAQALSMAQERGYDLVEVAPMASPPVTRFLDFGQYKYELAKREKEAKRRSRSVEFKEVRLRPKIGGGDFETKVHRAIEFLDDGDRIKVTVQFRGRELTHPEIGRNLLNRFADAIKEHGTVDRAPTLEGRSMSMTVTSTHKPKTEPGKPARPDAATAATPAPGSDEAPAGTPEAPAGTPEAPAAEQSAEASAQVAASNGSSEQDQRAPVPAPAGSPAGTASRSSEPAPATAGE
ncbi:MAG TPA: translation initiation factor IF-3, partial [Candidatus Limnocylindrales bacterium]|nr:translation initiation factor IF-3 [Candidatus Limnocylindrales bacterium]